MNPRPLLLMTWIVLILAGCSPHKPSAIYPPEKMPASFSEAHDPGTPDLDRWWEQFNDEVLNELMQQVFAQNLDIRQAFARVEQMQARIRLANAGRFPQLDLEGSGGRQRSMTLTGPQIQDTYKFSASAVFEVDVWNRLKLASDSATMEFLASQEDLRALFLTLSAGLVENYFLAKEQLAQIELAHKTIEINQKILNLAQSRYNQGMVSAEDIYLARQNLAAARTRLPVYQALEAQALNSISILSGQFPGNVALDPDSGLPDIPWEIYTGLPSDLLISRPDIKAALLRVKAADLEIGQAVTQRFPSFRLAGVYGGASDELRTILDSPNIFWNILLQIAQPVLDGGRRAAQVDVNRAIFKQNLVAYHREVLEAFREVEDSLALIREKNQHIQHLKSAEDSAARALELSARNYSQGLSDLLRVLESQRALHNAQSSLVTARRELLVYHVQLMRSLGGEWMDRHILDSGLTNQGKSISTP
jgi:outer membrane protein, multidrug efflux system